MNWTDEDTSIRGEGSLKGTTRIWKHTKGTAFVAGDFSAEELLEIAVKLEETDDDTRRKQ